MTDAIYDLKQVVCTLSTGDARFVLEVDEFKVKPGELVGLIGPSGSGKSTLLDLLCLVRFADSAGRFQVAATGGASMIDVAQTKANEREVAARSARREIGYVLQTGGLIPFISVLENVALPSRLTGRFDEKSIRGLLNQLGIGAKADRKPAALSSGERQRCAIARALAHAPRVVLADEPTAALDPKNADIVMNLLVEGAQRLNAAVVLASHDHERVRRFGFRTVSQTYAPQEAPNVVRSIMSLKAAA